MIRNQPEPDFSSREVIDAESSARIRIAKRAVAPLHEVVVTGIGVILPNCSDRRQLWQQLRDGQSQLQIEEDIENSVSYAVGRVRDFDCETYLSHVPRTRYANCHREQLLYLCSLSQACLDAELDYAEMASERVGLFDGTSRGNFAFWYDAIRSKLETPQGRFSLRHLKQGMPGQAVGIAAAMYHVKGPALTFNGTCASGAIAIGNAFRELQMGRIDVAFAGGHDAALVAPLFQMYRDAGLMSLESENAAGAVRPYAEHSKNVFGEGAITLVLETREHAEARGADVLAELVGYRHGNGGEHPTDVDFTGLRPAALIEDALKEAELRATDVDFVIGHGNGVEASDQSELNYMRRVFGKRTFDVPLISTKPIYGHMLGAASALNVAASVLMLREGYVIPTINIDETKVAVGFSHQANHGAAKLLRAGLAVTYGIGGQNVALALRKA
jgi:3-oxoacyl-[acyl-carrier-protein] synthase II